MQVQQRHGNCFGILAPEEGNRTSSISELNFAAPCQIEYGRQNPAGSILKNESDQEPCISEPVFENRRDRDLFALDQTQIEIVCLLSKVVGYHDEETGNHIQRMSMFCRVLAETSGFSFKDAMLLAHAAAMHDIGKIAIPDAILLKPGKLSEDEVKIMQRHTTIGAHLLEGSKSVVLQLAHQIALTHHEKWDGSGYPLGLKGEQIPMVGRITCICDVFDALISKRPYKAAWSLERAFQNIQNGSGKYFDPDLSMAMLKIESSIRRINEAFSQDHTRIRGINFKDEGTARVDHAKRACG